MQGFSCSMNSRGMDDINNFDETKHEDGKYNLHMHQQGIKARRQLARPTRLFRFGELDLKSSCQPLSMPSSSGLRGP